jgi:8-oxo-dGTP pyrophosphatase MutT (NUDIX family)
MQKRFIEQSGVIPFRFRRGQLEVLLVTASSGRGWTIPKGHLKRRLTPAESAAKEAFEEAGITGNVSTRTYGRYIYQKRGRRRHVTVYGLRVGGTLPRWPEMSIRRREWLSIAQASARVRNAQLRSCLQNFAERISARRRLAA